MTRQKAKWSLDRYARLHGAFVGSVLVSAFGGICEAGVSVHRNDSLSLEAADLVGDVHEHLHVFGSGAGS